MSCESCEPYCDLCGNARPGLVICDECQEANRKEACAVAFEDAAKRFEDWANKHDTNAVLKAEDAPASSEMHFIEATVARRHAALLRLWAKEAA